MLDEATAAITEPFTVAGEGWKADMHFRHGYLAIHPDTGDLPDAIAQMMTPLSRRSWTVIWSHESEDMWDVYLLERHSE